MSSIHPPGVVGAGDVVHRRGAAAQHGCGRRLHLLRKPPQPTLHHRLLPPRRVSREYTLLPPRGSSHPPSYFLTQGVASSTLLLHHPESCVIHPLTSSPRGSSHPPTYSLTQGVISSTLLLPLPGGRLIHPLTPSPRGSSHPPSYSLANA